MKNRAKIEEKYKWDLTDLCANDEEFYKKTESFYDYIPKYVSYKGKLRDRDTLLEYLLFDRKFTREFKKTYIYAYLSIDEIISDEKRNNMIETIDKFANKLSVETSFLTNEIHDLPDEYLDSLIEDPEFKDFDRMFKEIKKSRKHILSEKEEKLLAGMDFLGGYQENYTKLINTDIDFGEIEDSQGNKFPLNKSNYAKHIISTDRTLRKNAALGIAKGYADHINMIASNYINHVKTTCYFAKIRNYASSLSAALEGEEIDEDVYRTLISMVHKNLDLVNEFYKIKKQELGLDEIYGYDLRVEAIGKCETKKYTFEEAIEVVKKGLAPLGEEYVSLIDKAVKERWFDVFPNKDKHEGGYCTNSGWGEHSYILLNFEGTLNDVLTIAHELGHAMHAYYSHNNQPQEKEEHSTFLAEIASTTNEVLLINYLLQNADSDDEKRYLLNKFFIEVDAAIYTQTLYAEFEEKIHAMHEMDKPLTKEVVSTIFRELGNCYHGILRPLDNKGFGWARIPHLYTDFYVFTYATGMIAAVCCANRILSGKEDAAKEYIGFLSAGGSDKPTEILKKAGCDMTDEKTFLYCFDYLRGLLDEWKKLIK